MPSATYAFDSTGVLAANLITNEQHQVQEFNYLNEYFIIPLVAPFYGSSMLITFNAGGGAATRNLIEGVDYNLTLEYFAASRSIGVPIYGGISLSSSIITGTIALQYQTIGGSWVGNVPYVQQQLTQNAYNPRMIMWDTLTNVQTTFPPINHSLSIDQTYGQDQLVAAINAMSAQIAATSPAPVTIQTIVQQASISGLLGTDGKLLSQYLPTIISQMTNPVTGVLLTTVKSLFNLSVVATSGNYSDLSNKPTIPTLVSSLTNDSGYQTAAQVTTSIGTISTVGRSGLFSDLTSIPSTLAGHNLSAAAAAIGGSSTQIFLVANGTTGNQAINFSQLATATVGTASAVAWTGVSGKPTFATVATSGSYTDLINKPSVSGASPTVAGGVYGLNSGTNMGFGYNAFSALSTGNYNTAVGYYSLEFITTGTHNTSVGYNNLLNLTTGSYNTTIGSYAGWYTNQSGMTAIGYQALKNSSNYGTAVGYNALYQSTGLGNTAVGYNALQAQTASGYNTALGEGAGYSISTLNYITAIGYQACYSMVSSGAGTTAVGYQACYNSGLGGGGNYNTGIGWQALYSAATSSGIYNTAIGSSTLNVVTSGSYNTAIGCNAFAALTAGTYNIAIGYNAAYQANITATYNIAIGTAALNSLTNGGYNIGLGQSAASSITTGIGNIGIGTTALSGTATGSFNIGIGQNAATGAFTGNGLIGIGYQALKVATVYGTAVGYNAMAANTTGANNTAIGYSALLSNTTGSGNTVIGDNAGSSITTGSQLIVIGYNAQASSAAATNEITLGTASQTVLRTQATALTALSDMRDKTNFKPIVGALDFVNRLNAIFFDWNMRDGAVVGVTDSGFLAQELRQVQLDTGINIPGLVYDVNPERLEAAYGKLIPVYAAAIQEQNKKVDELESTLASAMNLIKQMQADIEALKAK